MHFTFAQLKTAGETGCLELISGKKPKNLAGFRVSDIFRTW